MCLELGQAVNLLYGLYPRWLGADQVPYFQSPGQPFLTFQPDGAPIDIGRWSQPVISMHQDISGLLDGLFDYRVAPFPSEPDTLRLPPGVLMLANENPEEIVDNLLAYLGLDLEEGSFGGFLLVKMRREAEVYIHEAERGGTSTAIRIKKYWRREGLRAMSRLRLEKRILAPERDAMVSHKGVQRFIDYFYEFGTHFISHYTLGDQLFQVFACRKERFPALAEIMVREFGGLSLSGLQSCVLASFTGADWMCGRGKILAASADPLLTAPQNSAAWGDPDGQGPSLLAPWLADSGADGRFFKQFGQTTPISLVFTSQSPYIEIFRSTVWRRLLKNALIQRYSGNILVPLRSRNLFPAALVFPHPLHKTQTSATTDIFDTYLTPTSWELNNRSALDRLNIWCLSLDLEKDCFVPGRRVRIFAYQVRVPVDGPVPTLVLEDEAFDDFVFACGHMQGALFVVNRSGTRRQTLLEGLRMGTGAQVGPEQQRFIHVCHPHEIMNPEVLSQFVLPISRSLDIAAIMIRHRSFQPQSAAFARGFAEWVAGLIALIKPLRQLRCRALLLARVTPCSGTNDLEYYDVRTSLEIWKSLNALPSHWMELEMQILAQYKMGSGKGSGGQNQDLEQKISMLGEELFCLLHRAEPKTPIGGNGSREECRRWALEQETAGRRLQVALKPVQDYLLNHASPEVPPLILEILARLLTWEITGSLEDYGPGDHHPIAVFWKAALEIRHTVLAITILEESVSGFDDEVCDLIEPLLESMLQPAPALCQKRGPILAASVSEILGAGVPIPLVEDLRTALTDYLETTDHWFSARIQYFAGRHQVHCPHIGGTGIQEAPREYTNWLLMDRLANLAKPLRDPSTPLVRFDLRTMFQYLGERAAAATQGRR